MKARLSMVALLLMAAAEAAGADEPRRQTPGTAVPERVEPLTEAQEAIQRSLTLLESSAATRATIAVVPFPVRHGPREPSRAFISIRPVGPMQLPSRRSLSALLSERLAAHPGPWCRRRR